MCVCERVFIYLHNDEDDEDHEDVSLRMFPGGRVTVIIKVFRHSLLRPSAIVKKWNQGLLLCKL